MAPKTRRFERGKKVVFSEDRKEKYSRLPPSAILRSLLFVCLFLICACCCQRVYRPQDAVSLFGTTIFYATPKVRKEAMMDVLNNDSPQVYGFRARTRSLVAVEPRRPPMTDVGTETAFRLDQRKHFRKSKHLLRSEVS